MYVQFLKMYVLFTYPNQKWFFHFLFFVRKSFPSIFWYKFLSDSVLIRFYSRFFIRLYPKLESDTIWSIRDSTQNYIKFIKNLNMSATSSSRKRPTSSRKTPNRKSNIKSRSNVLQILNSVLMMMIIIMMRIIKLMLTVMIRLMITVMIRLMIMLMKTLTKRMSKNVRLQVRLSQSSSWISR